MLFILLFKLRLLNIYTKEQYRNGGQTEYLTVLLFTIGTYDAGFS